MKASELITICQNAQQFTKDDPEVLIFGEFGEQELEYHAIQGSNGKSFLILSDSEFQ